MNISEEVEIQDNVLSSVSKDTMINENGEKLTISVSSPSAKPHLEGSSINPDDSFVQSESHQAPSSVELSEFADDMLTPPASVSFRTSNEIIIPETSVKLIGKSVNHRIKIMSVLGIFFDDINDNENLIYKSLTKVSIAALTSYCFFFFFSLVSPSFPHSFLFLVSYPP
jgi:hypothetical protein